MNLKLILFLLFFGILFNLGISQTTFYKTTDGILMTEENYLQIKKEMSEREDLAGRYQEILIKTENRNDTIIKTIQFDQIPVVLKENNKRYDPYAEQRKLIGTHFPIELFQDETGNNFTADFLHDKPTLVNFWFTNCPPCIEEIPDLHKLKKEFGDSVNFIAITFENQKTVEKFLKKHPKFDYNHITDSKKSISELKIKTYPMTFLLNKDGEILNVYGALMFNLPENLKQLLDLLCN